MRSDNKSRSQLAACFGMAAAVLTIAALSGCGGAGAGGRDPSSNNNNPNNNTPGINGTDIGDATTSLDGNTFTITSFKNGLSGFVAENNSGKPAGADGAVMVDTSSNGSEGTNSANLSVTNIPAAANSWIGLAATSNGGMADWSPYRYLKFDLKAGASGFNGAAAILTDPNWKWCAGPTMQIAANASGTAILDLSTCTGVDLTAVRKVILYTTVAGAAYIDNVRLEKVPPTPSGTDIADLTPDATGTGITLTSFKSGLAGFQMMDNKAGQPVNASLATVSLDSTTKGTEGTNSAAVIVTAQPATPAGNYLEFAVDGNGGVTDWANHRYLTFDVSAGATSFDGSVILQSKTDWSGWCQGTATTVAANSHATVTLDLSTCGTNADFANVKRLALGINSSTGTFYVDNIRVFGTPPAPATDLNDGANTAGVYTLTSFKNGLGSWKGMDDQGGVAAAASSATGTVTLDSAAAHATDGTNSAAVTVSTTPVKDAAGNKAAYGLALDSNGPLADWTGYRYIKADIVTGATPFNGTIVLQTNGWATYCNSTWTWIPANTPKTTLVFDLTSCTGTATPVLNAVNRIAIYSDQLGTFNVDNIRLDGYTAPPAADAADGASSVSATEGNVITLTSFKGATLGLWKGMDDQGGQAAAASSATGTVTLDTVAANATDGTHSAAVTVSTNPVKNAAGNNAAYGVALDSNGPLADWTGYRYIKADIVTGATPFNGTIVLQTNSWATYCNAPWTWINANTAKTTLVLDLNTCTGASLTAVSRLHIFSDQLGTFNIDNIRLTTQ